MAKIKNYDEMKRLFIFLVFLFASFISFAQTGTINNIRVSQQTDGSGMVDVYFDISGEHDTYTILLEVSFDGGENYIPVDGNFLEGDTKNVSPGSDKHIVWDGLASFPDTYSTETKVKIIANSKEWEQNIETGTLTDSRDDKTYKTVKIGDQWWMAENLAFLPEVSLPNQSSETEPNYYVYDYESTDVDAAQTTENYTTYGVLYNWPAAIEACPNGWHLPSDDEWEQLAQFISQEKGPFSKSGDDWYEVGKYLTNDSNSDDFKFSGLSGGYHYIDGVFYGIGKIGRWWSASENSTTNAWSRGVGYIYTNFDSYYFLGPAFYRHDNHKGYGLSVRCIRDSEQSSSKPSVETGNASEITQNTATLSGNVTSDGGAEVTERGFYWSTANEEPGEDDNVETAGAGLGEFSVTLTDLQTNTNYYFRAFATNAQGTATGSVLSFTTSEKQDIETGTLTDSRDNKTYKTVKIGDQWWMAENLAYLPSVSPSSKSSDIYPYYYVFHYQGTDVAAAKATYFYTNYGVLYNWAAAMDGAGSSSTNPSGIRGVCPSGWHLPSDDEWTKLENYLAENGYNYDETIGGGRAKIAKSLASTTGWNTHLNPGAIGNNLSLNNKSGFSALPGGYRSSSPGYPSMGFKGYWWSSEEFGFSGALLRALHYYNEFISRSNSSKALGCSIRCVKD